MATADQIIRIIKGDNWKPVKAKKVIRRRRRRKTTLRETMSTRGQDIKRAYIETLEKQIAVLERCFDNYTTKSDNTKMMKMEIKRLKQNLKKEINSMNDGIPVVFHKAIPTKRRR